MLFRSLPISAAGAVIHAHSQERPDDLFAAFLQDGGRSRRILLIPGFGPEGIFGIQAYDPFARHPVSWHELVAEHRDAPVRLVRVPSPLP